MKSPLITLITGLLLSVPAGAREHRPGLRGGPCAEFKLTDAQMAQMRDAHMKFEEERIDLEAKERHARLDLRRLLFAKDADLKIIRKSALTAAEASAKVHVAEELQRTEVLLSVFKPEQRDEAMRCAHDFPARFGGRHPRPGDELPPPPRDDQGE